MGLRPKPTLLDRIVVPKPWGGRALERVPGLALPGREPIGETWEVYDRPEGSSRLRGGGTLAGWMAEARDDLLGRGIRPTAGDRFPLLVKFIDARQALSVQVHPDEAQGRADGDGGKHEAWVVLEAGPAARIIRGVRPGIDPQEFARAAPTAEIEAHLHSFTPRTGDAIDVPPGMVHAIGPGVVVYEIQQNSDLTYRLYDWGRPRELHVPKALRAVRFHPPTPATVAPAPCSEGGEWLLRNAAFDLRRVSLTTPLTLPTDGAFKLATVIAGRGSVGWRSGGADDPLVVGPGDTVLVPACAGAVFLSPVGGMQVLVAGPGAAA